MELIAIMDYVRDGNIQATEGQLVLKKNKR